MVKRPIHKHLYLMSRGFFSVLLSSSSESFCPNLLLDERQERRKEDRAGGRAWEACKRARQESVHLLSSPSGFQPMPKVGLATQPKRRLPGGGVSRGAKLARTAE